MGCWHRCAQSDGTTFTFVHKSQLTVIYQKTKKSAFGMTYSIETVCNTKFKLFHLYPLHPNSTHCQGNHMRHAIPLTDNSFGRERRIIAISYQGGQRRLNLLTRSTVSQLSSLFFSTLDFSFEITGIHRGLVLPPKLDNKLTGWPRGPEETPGRRHRSKDLRSPTESKVCV